MKSNRVLKNTPSPWDGGGLGRGSLQRNLGPDPALSLIYQGDPPLSILSSAPSPKPSPTPGRGLKGLFQQPARRWKFFIAGMLWSILAFGCFQPSDQKLGITEVEGVPILWEYGIPYFTRFQQTDHLLLDLAGIWKFKPDPQDQGIKDKWFQPDLDDTDWFDHPVPGSWNVQKPEWIDYVGAGWYRKRFVVQKNFSGRFNRLVLDGVAFRGDVYLNGKFLASHSGGFSRWNLDVSDLLNYGAENFLAIRVDNRRSWDELPPLVHENGPLGFWPYGGIHRLVMIESGPQISVGKLSVSTDHTGGINLQVAIYNHLEQAAKPMVAVYLEDLEGDPVAELLVAKAQIFAKEVRVFKVEQKIDGLKPWSPEEPENRYRLVVEVGLPEGAEKQSLEIGFRNFEIRGANFYFNGRPFYLRGINRHEDDPKTGQAQTDERIAEDLDLLRQLNANLVRTSHYPDDPRFLDACDQKGLLVLEEISLHQVGWEYPGVRAAEKEPLFINAGRELLETIERDRNHPSLVMYSLGDESFTFFPSIRILHQRLDYLAKRFDHERPITMAVVTVPYRITPWLEMTAGVLDVISINEYYGWYYGELNQLSAFLDSVHKKWPDKPIIISELGAEGIIGRKPGELYPIGYGKERDFTEEYQLKFYREQLATIKSKPYISGIIPWCFADFRDDKRPQSAAPMMNTKGVLTYDRKKKQVFALLAEFYKNYQGD